MSASRRRPARDGAGRRPARARPVVTRRFVSWTTTGGIVLFIVLIAIAWRATSALWFLLFPVLLLGLVTAAAMAVLWGLRHV